MLFAADWLKIAALFLLSTRAMSRQQSSEANAANCCLCMCPLEDGLPEHLPCSHIFHTHCLDEFARSTNLAREFLRCPVCRLTPSDLDTAAFNLIAESTRSIAESTRSMDDTTVAESIRTQLQANLAPSTTQPLLLSQSSIEEITVSGQPTLATTIVVDEEIGQPDPAPIVVPNDSQGESVVEQTAMETPDYHDIVPPHLAHRIHPQDVSVGSGSSGSAGAPPPAVCKQEEPKDQHPDEQDTQPVADYHDIAPPHLSHQIHPHEVSIGSGSSGSACVPTPPPTASAIVPVQGAGGEPDGGEPDDEPRCFLCGLDAHGVKILVRYPVMKLQCKRCKRVDQAIGRAYGSCNWLRSFPNEKAQQFYLKAHSLGPRAIGEMCQHTIAFKDCGLVGGLVVGEWVEWAEWIEWVG